MTPLLNIDISEEDAFNIFEFSGPDHIGGQPTVHLNQEVKDWCKENLQDKMVYPYIRLNRHMSPRNIMDPRFFNTYGFHARYEKDVILFKLRWIG